MFWIGFIIGVFIGAFIMIFILALVSSNKEEENFYKNISQQKQEQDKDIRP